MTGHLSFAFCFFLFNASHMSLPSAMPSSLRAELQHSFSQSSLIEAELQSLKTETTEASSLTTSLQSLGRRGSSVVDIRDQAAQLTRRILQEWTAPGRRYSNFLLIQLNKALKEEKVNHSSLIRVVRSKIIKGTDYKKFGRNKLDQLAVRLMRRKKAAPVKIRAWKKFGRNELNHLAMRLMKRPASQSFKSQA